MRFLSPTLLVGLSLSALSASAADSTIVERLHTANEPLRRFVLDNGMVCLVKEDHSAPVAAVQIWVGTGSVDESPYLGAGLAHYMEHMIFKGTETRGPADISREISEAGGDINAFTSLDRTVFHTVLPSKNWRVGVDVLADAVMHTALPEEEWAREKEVIVREMAMGRDDPGRVLWKLMARTLYHVHPYRFPTIGYEEVFRSMTRQHLVDFVQEHYVPDNMITVVVGDFNGDEVETVLRQQFADFKRRPEAATPIPQEPPQLAPRYARETGAYKVSRLYMAWHTVALDDPDTPALDLLSYIVGHGRSSRLVKTIKEEQQLVFAIDASSYTPKDPGFFLVSATFEPDKEADAVRAISDEVATWVTTDFTAAEIEKARRQLLVQELAALTTMQGQADSYASGEFYAGDPRYGERYMAALQSVTADDLRTVAAKYLTADQVTEVFLSPAPTETAKAAEVEPPAATIQVERVELSNGIPLIVREDHRLPFVHICIALRGGLLSETQENSGITDLMSGLLTRGTERRSAEEIAATVEQLGASLSPFSGWNSFGLQGRALTSDANTLAEIMADCLLHPAFPEEELEKQRQVQLAAIRQEQEKPFFLAAQALKGLLFPAHPYRLNPAGTLESIGALDRDALVAHQQRLINRDNMVVAIFGDMRTDEARAMAERYLSDVAAGEPGYAHIPAPEPDLPARIELQEPKEQAILLIGYPGVTVDDPRVDALSLLREAVSGLSSDLGIEVREKRGLVYYVGAIMRTGPAPGFFTFYAGTREEAVPEVESLVAEQVKRLVHDGLREDELQRAKEQIIAGYEMSLQDNGGLAQSCALNELYGLGYDYSFSTEERIRSIKPDAVRDAAASILDPEKLTISVLLPEAKPEEDQTP